jgi:hypothetical protein
LWQTIHKFDMEGLALPNPLAIFNK